MKYRRTIVTTFLILGIVFSFFGKYVFATSIVGRQQVISVPVSPWQNANALLWLPTDYDAAKTYPLIIFLHGVGEAGTDITKLINTALPQRIANGFDPVAVNPVDGKTYEFIVVSPQAASWSYDEPQLKYILPNIEQIYSIDTSRVYITGLSAGGEGTWSSVTTDKTFTDKLAAVAPISAAPISPDLVANLGWVATSPVAVWDIIQQNDSNNFTQPNINFVNTINGMNPIIPAKITIIPGTGHSAWNQGYDPTWRVDGMNLYEWLLQYTHGNTVPINHAPTVNAGTDKTIMLPTSSVTLSGSATDSDGTIATYAWTKVSGGSATIASPSAQSTSVTGLVQGSYTFRLTATDNQGATASDDIMVTVNAAPVNSAPTANAGSDQTVPSTTTSVTLAGSGTDTDGTIASYAWSKLSGGTVTITSASSAATTVSGLTPGSYSFQLKVTDNAGATDSDSVTITVNTTATNTPPTVNAGTDKTITLPTNNVTLTGSATDNGSVASYLWAKVSGGAATITSPAQATTTITGLVAGTYTFRLTATDNLGLAGSDNVVVTVHSATNSKPTVSLTAPTNAATFTNPSAVTLSATAADSDGTISKVDFYQGTTLLGTDNSSPYTFSWTVSTDGTYALTAVATDNSNATTTSSAVSITVSTPVSGGGGGGGGGGTSTPITQPTPTPIPTIPSPIVYPAGCTETTLFSATTGLPCSQSQTVIPGCTSSTLFSPLTGMRCSQNISASSTATNTATQATVTALALNLRTAPVTGSVISKLAKGTTVTVLDRQAINGAVWTKVTTVAGDTGYVSNNYLQNTTMITPVASSALITVTAITLNVRSSPNGSVIGTATSGMTGTIVSGTYSSDYWVRVQFSSSLTGYVYRKYVK